jgi:CheY-like chemotaxis protein
MGNLTITTEKKGNVISISFQDDGPGISAENMGRLFEPFFTTKEPGEGTGLGLSISRSIVLEHNGKFMAESTEGHGAMFIVQIPMIENQPEIAEAPTPVPEVKSSATKKGRILVIDDEPGVRALLDSRLTKIGHSVDTISDAASAMEMIDAGTRYDVIITDVRMPGMSGFELYTLILRKMPEMKNRFIFITGDVMGADIKAFIHQNHLCAFSKPFETRALLDKIESMLSAEHLPV